MVRELTLETTNEQLDVDAAEILLLDGLRTLGNATFVVRRVTPPRMTCLHSLAVVNYTAEVADFVVDLPSLTELSIYNRGSNAVSMREPACLRSPVAEALHLEPDDGHPHMDLPVHIAHPPGSAEVHF
ncbi:hypothetical protein NESM_000903400 [Novymonas esmeraldas]|uniref:Uncharacterized protein n=1 Tax=Novymonas esmeraldas TaxID=1808958 RepID=A0AAW0F0Q3_9TRYP